MTPLHFIGSGALLSRAAAFAVACGLQIDAVRCLPSDGAIPRLTSLGIAVVETSDINREPDAASIFAGKVIVSINNPQRIGDALLTTGGKFFNIHNGLVKQYRGRGEVCVFAALCREESVFGVSLQQVLPGRCIDGGPLVAQISFDIDSTDGFSSVMSKAMKACEGIFEQQIHSLIAGTYEAKEVSVSKYALTYKDVARLCATATPRGLERASDLGNYANYLPNLRDAIAQGTAQGHVP